MKLRYILSLLVGVVIGTTICLFGVGRLWHPPTKQENSLLRIATDLGTYAQLLETFNSYEHRFPTDDEGLNILLGDSIKGRRPLLEAPLVTNEGVIYSYRLISQNAFEVFAPLNGLGITNASLVLRVGITPSLPK